jgi:mannose-6-phosphate isomerase-like protein (cupin superfamily)
VRYFKGNVIIAVVIHRYRLMMDTGDDRLKETFSSRQEMITSDFEMFHYSDNPTLKVADHNHNFFEVYFLISGNVSYMIEGKIYKLIPGDIVLINNKELHKPLIETGKLYERYIIWVDPNYIRAISDEETDLTLCFENSAKERYNLLRPNSELLLYLKNIYMKLETVYSNQEFGNSVLKKLYIAELLVYLNKAYFDTNTEEIALTTKHNKKICEIIDYINRNLEGNLSLSNISKI